MYGGSMSMSQSLLGSMELPLEVVDEYDEDRECPERGRLSGAFSRPREAMSSTNDGKVVMVVNREPGTVSAPTLL